MLEGTKDLTRLTNHSKRFAFEPRVQSALQILVPVFAIVGAGTGVAALGTATQYVKVSSPP